MSVFPTKILLATDGSKEAASASQTAAELAQKTAPEVHVVHVQARIVPHSPGYYVGPEVVEHAQQRERERLNRKPRCCWTLRWRKSKLPAAA